MSAFVEPVRAANARLSSAKQHRAAVLSERNALGVTASQKRQHASNMRADLLSQKAAGAAGGPRPTLTLVEVQEVELDADAAENALRRFEPKVAQAEAAVKAAEENRTAAVYAYALDCEARELESVQEAVDELFRRCARAIAAAKICREHGKIRGSDHLGPSHMYGSAGRLVNELWRSVEWPKWPYKIEPPMRPQYTTTTPRDLPGVAEAEEELLAALDSGGDDDDR